jgi:HSP20 family protein
LTVFAGVHIFLLEEDLILLKKEEPALKKPRRFYMKNNLIRSRNQGSFLPSFQRAGLPRVFDMMNEMEEFLDRSWGLPESAEMQNYFAPAVDVTENEKEYLFTVDAPGVSEKDIQVSLTGHQLSISGERRREEEEKTEKSYRSEREFGQFQRSFLLPEEVNTDQIEASFKDGVLKVRVPKVEAAKAKSITINANSSRSPNRPADEAKH